MSILLDALRKSEQRERLGSVPDIHGDPEPSPARRRSAWRLLLIMLAVLLVLVAAAWLAWRVWGEAPVPVAPPELPPEPAPAVAAPTPAAPSAAGSAGESTVAAAASPRLDRQPRSPVEVLSGDRPHRRAGSVGDSSPSSSPSSSSGPPASARPAPGSADRQAADRAAADAQAERAEGTQDMLDMLTRAVEEVGVDAPADEADAEPPAADRAAPPRREAPGLISYWQLPENVRSGLPEPRITVLAWDDNPEARFAILGGKRFGEGSRVASNLTLEEIRRDRILFRHGAYLFYVKQ